MIFAATTAASVGQDPPLPNRLLVRNFGDASGLARPMPANIGFDPEGYEHGRGLQKDLFYWSPFMTCSRCNTLAFIDAARARSFSAVLNGHVAPAAVAALKPEPLPKCEKCGSTDDWWMGSHNLLKLLGANQAELELRIRKEKNGAARLQAAYRRYLRARWARAEVTLRLVSAMLHYRAASVVASIVRGRLGRRRSLTFMALSIVRGAHAKLLKEAVRGDPKIHKRKCFWYRREQVPVLFEDYLVVARRTGFAPPRTIVETNIMEIARRIRVREAFLATLIQARFRGMQARRFLHIFHREVVRVREIRFAASQRIQRLFRAWVSRRVVEAVLVAKFKGRLLRQHLESRREDREKRRHRELSGRLMERYCKERAEERSARVTGLTHPSAAQGRKMKAFQESAYGYDAVTSLVKDLTGSVFARRRSDRAEDEAHRSRLEFVRRRQEEAGRPLQIYYKDELEERSRQLIEKLANADSASSPNKIVKRTNRLLRDHNERRIRFNYPGSVYVDPIMPLYEGTGIEPPKKSTNRRRRRIAREQHQAAEHGGEVASGRDRGDSPRERPPAPPSRRQRNLDEEEDALTAALRDLQ